MVYTKFYCKVLVVSGVRKQLKGSSTVREELVFNLDCTFRNEGKSYWNKVWSTVGEPGLAFYSMAQVALFIINFHDYYFIISLFPLIHYSMKHTDTIWLHSTLHSPTNSHIHRVS